MSCRMLWRPTRSAIASIVLPINNYCIGKIRIGKVTEIIIRTILAELKIIGKAKEGFQSYTREWKYF